MDDPNAATATHPESVADGNAITDTPPSHEADAVTTNEHTGQSRSRNYGKGFIYLHLADADDYLRKIDSHAKRMSKQGFAVALGHKKPNGRFIHKLDALEEYGLIESYKAADDVVLTNLAVEMLYGGSEPARLKGRVTAFLKCENFRQTFTECPKNQDHSLAYVREFVEAKLGIRNDVDRYMRLFLESAKFAGLLEGEVDPSASTIKLKPVGSMAPADPQAAKSPQPATSAYKALTGDAAQQVLNSMGLANYEARAQVEESTAGKVTLKYENSKCVLEVNRPLCVTIGNADALTDLPDILKALKESGYDF